MTVVDQGIDYSHTDLRENFDIDTSGSAFGDPTETLPKEEVEHGTQVAGVIGARDNGVGVVGVAPRATISAYQIFSPGGDITDTVGLVKAGESQGPRALPRMFPSVITAGVHLTSYLM